MQILPDALPAKKAIIPRRLRHALRASERSGGGAARAILERVRLRSGAAIEIPFRYDGKPGIRFVAVVPEVLEVDLTL